MFKLNRHSLLCCAHILFSFRITYLNDVGNKFTTTPINAVEQMLPIEVYVEDNATVVIVLRAQ